MFDTEIFYKKENNILLFKPIDVLDYSKIIIFLESIEEYGETNIIFIPFSILILHAGQRI